MSNAFERSLQATLDFFAKKGVPLADLTLPVPDNTVDFFSNDYLGFSTNQSLRTNFLRKLNAEPQILGSRGSRLADGNTPLHVKLEERLKIFFNGPSALVFNSGADANVGMWATLPQRGDVVIYDELVHASMHDGLRVSAARDSLFPFRHNSIDDLRSQLIQVLSKYPNIKAGKSSVFILTDAIYSMHGDFAPLAEIVETMNEILLPGVGHVFVDEAHSTGTVGHQGRGLTCMLGLENSISIRLHTFGKAMGTSGAVIVCSPIVRKYLINACRNFVFTTASTRAQIINMDSAVDMLESQEGDDLAERVQEMTWYTRHKLSSLAKAIPRELLSVKFDEPHFEVHGKIAPIIPVMSPHAAKLAKYLIDIGYIARAVLNPAVPRGQERIRVTVHATNTKSEVDAFVLALQNWVNEQMEYTEGRARL